MRSGCWPATAYRQPAHAPQASPSARGVSHSNRLREIERERMLADAARTVNEQRMRPARALRRASNAPRRRCHGNSGGQGRRAASAVAIGRHAGKPSAFRCAATSARTTSTGRVLSMTRNRCGKAAARSR